MRLCKSKLGLRSSLQLRSDVRLNLVFESLRITARKPQHKVGPRVVLTVELLYIIDRQLLQGLDGANVLVSVCVPLVDRHIQRFLPKLFVVVAAKTLLQKVNRVRSKTRKVIFAKARI